MVVTVLDKLDIIKISPFGMLMGMNMGKNNILDSSTNLLDESTL